MFPWSWRVRCCDKGPHYEDSRARLHGASTLHSIRGSCVLMINHFAEQGARRDRGPVVAGHRNKHDLTAFARPTTLMHPHMGVNSILYIISLSIPNSYRICSFLQSVMYNVDNQLPHGQAFWWPWHCTTHYCQRDNNLLLFMSPCKRGSARKTINSGLIVLGCDKIFILLSILSTFLFLFLQNLLSKSN